MKKYIKCGTLFTSHDEQVQKDQTVVIENGRIIAIGANDSVVPASEGDQILDYSKNFVMPGLIDIHVHLSYGNALSEEDIDIYSPVEYRALRGLQGAQRVLRAGFTSLADPATTGHVTPAIRDSIECGLFVGPRISSGGRQITNRQGLSDWYPTWIGVPDTSIGALAENADAGIQEIRKQKKQGVDFVKIAMDGDSMNPATGLVSGYNQAETTAMVDEAHRLGLKVIVHARGTEGVLYAARACVDVILHASWMDDEGLEAVIQNNCKLCPTLSLVLNDILFTQPTDGCYPGFPDAHREELEAARKILPKAREAGVTFMLGSDSGFAVTPYGEWHARELEYYVDYLGFTPAEAIICATKNNREFLREHNDVGILEVGRYADIIVVDGNPLADITLLQKRENLISVMKAGEHIEIDILDDIKPHVLEHSYSMWGEVYTQERVREIFGTKLDHVAPRAAE